jgi:Spy/CpxP family protein refolding chaperone
MTQLRLILVAASAVLAVPLALAQHEHDTHAGPSGAEPARNGPYAGMQGRAIKALSDQQMADLRAGKGMSLALPAELNGYPGPVHALELAEPLKLTAEQRARTEAHFKQMQREAQAAGEEVIVAETALDKLFKSRRADAHGLKAATTQAALAQGQLREMHLRYHLSMLDVLSPAQVAAYNRLRGY